MGTRFSLASKLNLLVRIFPVANYSGDYICFPL